MLLAVEAHVISARSVLFLLPRIGTAEVIGILGSPLLIGFLLLLAPTFGPTTRLLPSLEPRVRVIPMTTERTPPSREHTFLLQPTSSGETNLTRSEEHTSELQSLRHLVCRLLLEKKKKRNNNKRHKNTDNIIQALNIR